MGIASLLGRHDTRIAIFGTAILTAGYFWGVTAPGWSQARQIQKEIEDAQARMGQLPVLMEQRAQLVRRLNDLKQQHQQLIILLPVESHVSDVLRHVAGQAQTSRLTITRLEPLASIPHASYTAHPFQLSCRGQFSDIAHFLAGLESHTRLLTFGNVDFQRSSETAASDSTRTIQVNFHFSVYSRHAEFTELTENASKSSGDPVR